MFVEGLGFYCNEHCAILAKNDLCCRGVVLGNGWVCTVKQKKKSFFSLLTPFCSFYLNFFFEGQRLKFSFWFLLRFPLNSGPDKGKTERSREKQAFSSFSSHPLEGW